MAKINGTSMLVVVDGTAIGSTKSFTLDLKSTNLDTSNKGSSGWTDRIYGKRDWSVSFEGLYDASNTFNVEEVFDLIDTRNQVYLEMADLTGVGTGVKFVGYAVASGLTINAPLEEPVTISGTFEADGPLDKGTVAAS